MTALGTVRLAPEGTGPYTRTLTIGDPQKVDASGNAVTDRTANQEIVSLADKTGDLLDDPRPLLAAIHEEQRRTNELLELLIGSLS